MADEDETLHHEEEEDEDSDVDVEDDGAEDQEQEDNGDENKEEDEGMQEQDDQEDENENENENENGEEDIGEEGGEGEGEEEQDLVAGEGEKNDVEGEEADMDADAHEGGDDTKEAAQADTKITEAADTTGKEAASQNEGGGKKWEGEPDKDPMRLPPHGTEVFVGGIPPGTSEEDLKEALGSAGEIFAVRIAKDPLDQSPRGFAFVTYKEKEAAAKAVADFTSLEVKGKSVRVNNSQSKHRLFVGGIPRDLTKEELRKHLDEVTVGAESIDLPINPQNSAQNRGFMFIDFYNHAAADHSRRKMTRQDYRLAGKTVTVSWAEAKSPEASASDLAQVKVLYVKGLPETASDEKLRELFVKYGEIERAIIPPPKPGQAPRNFGFVHFVDRKSAVAALEKDQKHEMEGNELEVSLARPPPDRQSRGPQAAPAAGAYVGFQQPYGGYAAPVRGGGAYGAYGGSSYASGSGSRRGGQAQAQAQPAMPFIQAPAGMTMVAMQLPDGQVGYILQQAGTGGPVRGQGQTSSTYGSNRGSGQSGARRYHPYT